MTYDHITVIHMRPLTHIQGPPTLGQEHNVNLMQ